MICGCPCFYLSFDFYKCLSSKFRSNSRYRRALPLIRVDATRLLSHSCDVFIRNNTRYFSWATYKIISNIMKISNHSTVPVYTISGSSTARPLPEWLARKRKRSLKKDPEYASRVELLQDFEFEEASQCIRASDDGHWVMSTGASIL